MTSRQLLHGLSLALLSLSIGSALAGLPDEVDLKRSGRATASTRPNSEVGADVSASSASSRVEIKPVGDTLRFSITPTGSDTLIRFFFNKPLSTQGKERLVLEGRSDESTGERLTVGRLDLLDSAGKVFSTYEPDLHFPPEWNLREVLLRDFDKPASGEIAGLQFRLWAPSEVGKTYTLHLRLAETWSSADLAKALTVPARTPRQALAPQAQPGSPTDNRWTNLGPGGGGWYRVVGFSPINGDCFVGSDVGGIYRSTDNCKSWKIVNDGVPQLYVSCFAFHPTDAKVIFAGCYGGLLKSTDGGSSWQLKRKGFPPLQTYGQSAPVSAITVDPENPSIVYAGLGHERDYGSLSAQNAGGRIYRSSDGGESWQGVDLPGGKEARGLSTFCIVRHPQDGKLLYATTQKGLLRSTDAGASWQAYGSGLEKYSPTFLAIRRDQPATMLMAYHSDKQGEGGGKGKGGVLKSEDAGATWKTTNQGLPDKPDCWRLFADPRDAQTFYVGWHRGSGLFVTRDSGASWQSLNLSDNIESAWFFRGINVTGIDIDPRNPQRMVYCNDMDLYQTTNGGKRWEQVATELAQPATEDHPAVWKGRGPEVMCVGGPQALAVDPTNPRTVWFGYWDIHAWKSDDGIESSYRITSGIHSGYDRMGAVVLDPADPEIVYMSVGRNNSYQRIYKSINGGRRFHLVGHVGSGLPDNSVVFSMAIDPNSPRDNRTVYAAVTGYGVYRSTDGGLSWADHSNGLPKEASRRHLLQLVMDPSNPRRLFLAVGAKQDAQTQKRMSGYIARSEDGGENWQVVKDGIEPQCVLIDPHDPQRIYAGNRNFSGIDFPNALYRSEDGGNTWTAITQDLFLKGPGSLNVDKGPRIEMTCLAADPSTPGLIYAACCDVNYDINNGRGMFISRDWGKTWAPFSHEGLDNYRVATLVVDPVNPARIYVGTRGNGIFRFGPAPKQAE